MRPIYLKQFHHQICFLSIIQNSSHGIYKIVFLPKTIMLSKNDLLQLFSKAFSSTDITMKNGEEKE